MKLWTLALALMAVLSPWNAFADDCDESTVRRDSAQFTVKRVLLADGKTTDTTSTKCVPPQHDPKGGATAAPWDFYMLVGEEGNTCTSWTATVRHYPINAAASCRGTCDAHTLFALAKGGTTTKYFVDPLGEAMDVVTTSVDCSGGVNIYADFYYRNQNR